MLSPNPRVICDWAPATGSSGTFLTPQFRHVDAATAQAVIARMKDLHRACSEVYGGRWWLLQNCLGEPERGLRRVRAVSSIRERIVSWFKHEREYEPPPGRLTEDTIQRLPDGGLIRCMPGDGIDPTSLNGQAGRNP